LAVDGIEPHVTRMLVLPFVEGSAMNLIVIVEAAHCCGVRAIPR
jgi:hypothetical protein